MIEHIALIGELYFLKVIALWCIRDRKKSEHVVKFKKKLGFQEKLQKL